MEMSLKHLHFNSTQVYKNDNQKVPPIVSQGAHRKDRNWLSKQGVCVCVCLSLSRVPLCDPMQDCVCVSLSRVPPHGVYSARLHCPRNSQARILEWVAISLSGLSSQPRDRTQVSCIAGRFFTVWSARIMPCKWTYSRLARLPCVFKWTISPEERFKPHHFSN